MKNYLKFIKHPPKQLIKYLKEHKIEYSKNKYTINIYNIKIESCLFNINYSYTNNLINYITFEYINENSNDFNDKIFNKYYDIFEKNYEITVKRINNQYKKEVSFKYDTDIEIRLFHQIKDNTIDKTFNNKNCLYIYLIVNNVKYENNLKNRIICYLIQGLIWTITMCFIICYNKYKLINILICLCGGLLFTFLIALTLELSIYQSSKQNFKFKNAEKILTYDLSINGKIYKLYRHSFKNYKAKIYFSYENIIILYKVKNKINKEILNYNEYLNKIIAKNIVFQKNNILNKFVMNDFNDYNLIFKYINNKFNINIDELQLIKNKVYSIINNYNPYLITNSFTGEQLTSSLDCITYLLYFNNDLSKEKFKKYLISILSISNNDYCSNNEELNQLVMEFYK